MSMDFQELLNLLVDGELQKNNCIKASQSEKIAVLSALDNCLNILEQKTGSKKSQLKNILLSLIEEKILEEKIKKREKSK